MLATVFSTAVIGVDAEIVEVEVDIAQGLPSLTIVGLPEASVKESRERVKSAIQNSGYRFPDDRITVNLAPANLKKEGTGLDLPIAMGVLAATGLVPQERLQNCMVLGELSLDGRVKAVAGALPAAIAAKRSGFSRLLVPAACAAEGSVVNGTEVIPLQYLYEALECIRGERAIPPVRTSVAALLAPTTTPAHDFSEVMGQEQAKRALEIAAAGGHNLMMIGPPGSGKTMLAKRLPGILPPMSFTEALETTKIYSVTGQLPPGHALVTRRPFRAPHHTVSDAGLIGGGHLPKPGEVSMAHNGVLFLDELPEYKKHVLEVLRQPLEERRVTIARAAMSLTYPAAVMLVAAMNPCPCGYLTDSKHACRCSSSQIQRYRAKVSGPLLDRLDLHVSVPAVPWKDLQVVTPAESSRSIQQRVARSRQRQQMRFEGTGIHCNARMGSRHVRRFCAVDPPSARLLEAAVDKLGLSARAYHRILKIARTIADLADSPAITANHVAEAIQYRSLDRKNTAFA
jgi:magnesium chelatase family protein